MRWDVNGFTSSLGEFTPGGSAYNLTSVDISNQDDVSSDTVTFRLYYYAVAGDIYHSDTGPFESLDSTAASYSTYGRCFSIWGDNVCTDITSTDTRTECDSYTWMDGTTYTSSNNTATYTIVGGAENGCDSIVTLNLTINNISDITTSTSGTTISSNSTEASHQWLDCNNNNAIISAETEQSFTATSSGSYAVELTENGCKDTSECVVISSVNIIENNFGNNFGNNLIISPNPTNGVLSVDLKDNYKSINTYITDLKGKLIKATEFKNTNSLSLNIDAPSGIYFLTIKDGNNKTTVRIVKE